MRPARWVGATLLVTLGTSVAAAGDDDDDDKPKVVRALLETAVVLGVEVSLYIATYDDSKKDFDLHWDWESWRKKLDLSAVNFDTNSFRLNAVGHPLQSLVVYRTARANHFGMLASELYATAYGVFWEYFIEYREGPSVNDMIVGATTGLEIGEPMWQVAQLWRGGDVTVADRVRTTIFSPVDGLHDLVGHHRYRPRRQAWRSVTVEAGAVERFDEGTTRTDAAVGLDIDLVADRNYLSPAAHAGPIEPGSWSRVRGRLQGTDQLTNVEFETRTAITGHYRQDAEGHGLFTGLGAAFSYHRDRLADTWDHVAVAHVIGPQLQVSYRAPALAVRWDVAAYGDFDMIDALVFAGEHAFVQPPPYVSVLQAEGYYYGVGATATTRLRVDTVRWSLDTEIAALRAWQVDGPDRLHNLPPVANTSSTTKPLYNAHGNSDTRAYGRGELTYHAGRFGLSATVEGEYRAGQWKNLDKTSSATSVGVLVRTDL